MEYSTRYATFAQNADKTFYDNSNTIKYRYLYCTDFLCDSDICIVYIGEKSIQKEKARATLESFYAFKIT